MKPDGNIQMAEALFRKHCGAQFDVYSAGASEIHPLAVRVMEEIGLPLTDQSSKDSERECPKLPEVGFIGARK